ncbi:hypothetical protein CAPTEDRAFT_114139 [Capitella teleta]|uniref:Peroxisomal membrane protein 4 n=1 Tax=Capitella teleta TaxID=283909 RepID=R7V7L4_CAPTE|nr:hypothetical protein CAPTEDRAFT_114139 [Capitella teleta]|eukprot:ELU14544.1 hypothetical protein CAPTEDRAFT_114139 [Capitella teleta]
MATSLAAVNQLLASGRYHTILSIIKGFRNGVVYGSKIRFPHALVMTLLFKGGPIKDQVQAILEATYTHAKNLATFVFTYKTLTALLCEIESKPREYHSFIAAFIGGYLVFGKYNKINEQINLYLLSRVLYGLVRMFVEKGYIPSPPEGKTFPWFGAIIWGLVLWQFEHHQHTLQPSLQSSMSYLYHDSNKWDNFKNFLIYNR